MEIAFGILGQTALLMHGNVDVNWAGPRPRQVLTALLTAPNRRLSLDVVVDWVWEEHEGAPQDAHSTLHQSATKLRRAFHEKSVPANVSVSKGGCLLEIEPALIDHFGFQAMMDRARRFRGLGQHDRALVEALSAVRLCRDEALADLRTERADGWRALWERSEWIPANAFVVAEYLAIGQADAAVRKLAELEQAHPRELSFEKLRIRALAEADQPAEAADFFRATYTRYREAGETRAAEELRAVNDKVLIRPDRVISRRKPAPLDSAGQNEQVIRHLPPDVDDVAGRADLIALLDAYTTDSAGAPKRAAVVVTGGPGVGKTTLAAKWAHRAERRYRHGAVMLDLRGDSQAAKADAGEIVDTLLSLLDFPVDQVVNPIARAAKLSALLARRSMLVILDNVRSSDQVAPLLGVLSSCTVLIVSRWRLKSLSAKLTPPVITVGALGDPYASSMLTRRIGPRAREDVEGVEELVRLCRGNPLALTLVAERAISRAGTRMRTLASQLRDAELLLDLGDEGDWPGMSLRSAFALSYHDLEPAEQRVFALIGLHPSAEMTTAVIAAADGRPESEVRRSLDILVAAHLIEHPADLDRYRVHDLLHLYAASLAARLPDVDLARRKMFEFYLRVVIDAYRLQFPHKELLNLPPMVRAAPTPGFRNVAEARQWVLRERASIMAISAASEGVLNGISYLLPAMASEFFILQGRYPDAIEGLTIAVRAATAQGDTGSLASCLNDLAVVHMLSGADDAAEQCLLRALELVDSHGIAIGGVTVRLNLARVHFHAGRAAEAVERYRKVLPSVRALGEPVLCARAEHRFADALLEMGGHEEEALALYREALRHRRDVGDATELLRAHAALGELLVRLGRLAEASVECAAGQALVEASQDLPTVMKLNTVLAQLRHAEGDARAALRHAHLAVALANRTRHATGRARALSALAAVLCEHGDPEDARELWQEAAELYRGRARLAKANAIEALLAELDANGPLVPAARKGDGDTVAMPPPHLRIVRDHRS
ncbi:tetratricopeptide repeat protein [Amycolatopsis sp. WAC 04182]|uniref:AfsR/SARP family transcriptional regulator n=1 Tax=Amycolatopsis sp. WAC 04182 TaxID=2203198 RepID=UPI000F77A599|nr:tetratricopeptide repeat protein [Amycolatopsis sp. WAC 04182]